MPELFLLGLNSNRLPMILTYTKYFKVWSAWRSLLRWPGLHSIWNLLLSKMTAKLIHLAGFFAGESGNSIGYCHLLCNIFHCISSIMVWDVQLARELIDLDLISFLLLLWSRLAIHHSSSCIIQRRVPHHTPAGRSTTGSLGGLRTRLDVVGAAWLPKQFILWYSIGYGHPASRNIENICYCFIWIERTRTLNKSTTIIIDLLRGIHFVTISLAVFHVWNIHLAWITGPPSVLHFQFLKSQSTGWARVIYWLLIWRGEVESIMLIAFEEFLLCKHWIDALTIKWVFWKSNAVSCRTGLVCRKFYLLGLMISS